MTKDDSHLRMTKRSEEYNGRVSTVIVTLIVLVLVPLGMARAQPANDDFADAVVIESLPFAEERDMSGATVELFEPQPSCATSGFTGVPTLSTVWYRFTPSTDTTVAADTSGTNASHAVAVYEGGPSLSDLQEIACDDESQNLRVVFSATAGVTYHLQVSFYDPTVTPRLHFALDVAPPPGIGYRDYVPMSDGVELAVYLSFPPGWDGRPLPAILEYDGYDGGATKTTGNYDWLIDTRRYVWVHAGVRGAGCSGGQFSLFSQKSAEDGADLIEWIAHQPWSTGDVGIFGHSYSGMMGILVAAERPQHLRVVSVSGLISDFYRDQVYPGGIPNSGIPALWTAVIRPGSERDAVQVTLQDGDPRCALHIASRPPPNPAEDPVLHGSLENEDSDWWHQLSPGRGADRIVAPIQIYSAYQEWNSNMARGPALIWQTVPHDQKQLLLTNGDHGSWFLPAPGDSEIVSRRQAWLDHYLLGIDNGIDREPRVQVFLDAHRESGAVRHTGIVTSDSFPLSQTHWTKLYARENGLLSEELPDADGGSDLFLNGTYRHLVIDESTDVRGGVHSSHAVGQELFWSDGPDSVTYRTAAVETARVVAGPLLATLHAKVYGIDAEFFVQLADEDGEGNRSLLQWGQLKASHRALDPSRSWYDGAVMYRPWHPHTNPQLLAPGEVAEFVIEVWPVGFVLRPGHRLVMIVASPPLIERLNFFQPQTGPFVVELLRTPDHPTSLLVPFMDAPADLGSEVPCGDQIAVKCAKPLLAE